MRGSSWAWTVAAVGIVSLVAVPSLAVLRFLAVSLQTVEASLVKIPPPSAARSGAFTCR